MVTYYEVKNLISRIICGRNLEEDNDNDIIVDRSRFRGLPPTSEDNQIIIKNSDLQELYNNVLVKKYDNLQTSCSSNCRVDYYQFKQDIVIFIPSRDSR